VGRRQQFDLCPRPIGQGAGYDASFTNQAADLVAAWPDRPWTPGFIEGTQVATVCESMK
jgi:hypothetical protein